MSDDWRISLRDCLDVSIHRMMAHANSRRVMGHPITSAEALAMFREEWDACMEDVYAGEGQDIAEFYRKGEICARKFAEFAGNSDGRDIIAFDIRGVQSLPRGRSARISIDEIYRRGDSAVLCRYITDETGLRKDLAEDLEARVSALWATYSLQGTDRIVLQWRYLLTGDETECPVRKQSMGEAAEKLSEEIAAIESDPDYPPVLGEGCSECPHRNRCRHYLSSINGRESMPQEEIESLVEEYSDLDEKIAALRQRMEMLQSRRDTVKAKIVAYADSTRCDMVDGRDATIGIRRYKKANLPKDKTAVIKRLKETGQYDSISMVNYSRLRSDIAKGIADPVIAKMAEITYDVRMTLTRKRRSDRKSTRVAPTRAEHTITWAPMITLRTARG